MRKIRPIIMFFCCFFLASCSSTISSRISIERKGKKERSLDKIKNSLTLYEMGEIDAAIANLISLVDQSYYCKAQDQAYELLVSWLLQTKRYEEAKRYGSRFLLNQPQSKSAEHIVSLFAESNIEEKISAPVAVLDLVPEKEVQHHQDIELDGLFLEINSSPQSVIKD